jgi:hypothetical protein
LGIEVISKDTIEDLICKLESSSSTTPHNR